MGQPAARLTDMHICPMVTVLVPHVGGPVVGQGAPTVLIGSMPAARVTDMVVCVGPPDLIVKGSSGVFISGMPAARLGDNTAHGGVLVFGCPTVIIGETGGGGGGGGGGGRGSSSSASGGVVADSTGAVGASVASVWAAASDIMADVAALPNTIAQAEAMGLASIMGLPFVQRCLGS